MSKKTPQKGSICAFFVYLPLPIPCLPVLIFKSLKKSSIFSTAHLIVPYGEQSSDMVRLNGAWVAFPLKRQNCNEVRRQKKMKARERGGGILHCWEQRVYVQQLHKAGVIHLKGFCVCATFSPAALHLHTRRG